MYIIITVYYVHGCVNMTEWIEVLLGMEILGDPENIVLDGGVAVTPTYLMWPSPNYFGHLFLCEPGLYASTC